MASLERNPQPNEENPLQVVEWMQVRDQLREKVQKQIREQRNDPTYVVEDILKCHESDEDFRLRMYLLNYALLLAGNHVEDTLNQGRTLKTLFQRRGIEAFEGEDRSVWNGGIILPEKVIVFSRAGGTSQELYRKSFSIVIATANNMFKSVGKPQIPSFPSR